MRAERDPMIAALVFTGMRWRGLIMPVLLGVATALSALGLAALSAWLITRAWQMPPVLYLTVAVTAVRALGISRGLFRYLERLATHDFALRAMADARTRLYRVLSQGSPGFTVGLRQSELMARTADDVDEIGKGAQNLLAVDPQRHVWGLGRHFLGSNMFWYFRDPAGNFAEYFTDLDQIPEDAEWDARNWEPDKSLYAWGPPPSPDFIAPPDVEEIARAIGAQP